MKKYILGFIIATFIIFSPFSLAEISQQSYHYLDQKEFSAAKSSLETDLLQDKFDAKSWYFYSRTLYQLDMPTASMQALNNALNIDKSGSFAKGGMSKLKGFGADILTLKEEVNDPYYYVEKITGEQYLAYLNTIFGNGHPYGNMNPPSKNQIEQALRKTQNINQNPIVNTPKPASSSYNETIKKENIKNELTAEEKIERENTIKGFFLLLALIFAGGFLVYIVSKGIKNKKETKRIEKNKKELMAKRQKSLIELFNNCEKLKNMITEKLKDINLIAPLSGMEKMFTLYQNEIIELIKNINLDNLNKDINNETRSYQLIKNKFDKLNQYYKLNDYELIQYNKDLQSQIAKEQEERRKEEQLRKEKEEKAKIQREKELAIKQQREKELQEQAIKLEEERRKNGYYNRRQEQSTSLNPLDVIIGASVLNSALNNKNNTSSHKKTSINNRSNNDDDNNDFWSNNKPRTSNNNSNDNNDFWNSSKSNDDNNSSFWGSSSNSKKNDDHKDW